MSSAGMPQAKRLRIGVFGKRNSGKSSLVYALMSQEKALASGKVTDPVFRAAEIRGLGPVTFMDTIGFDDIRKPSEQQTKETAAGTDIAIVLVPNASMELELAWMNRLRKAGAVVIPVVSCIDELPDEGREIAAAVQEASGRKTLRVSTHANIGLPELMAEIARHASA